VDLQDREFWRGAWLRLKVATRREAQPQCEAHMSAVPRRLPFKGCTTRDEAVERMRLWLDDIHADSMREIETNLLCELDDDVPDVDYGDECIAFVQTKRARAREEAPDALPELMEEHNIGPMKRREQFGRAIDLGAAVLEN
jgi:hypothetical protein